MTDLLPSASPDESAVAQLILKTIDAEGSETHFRLHATTPFQKLFNAIARTRGLSPTAIRFVYEGKRLSPHETPESMDMQTGDTIDLMLEQVGGGV